MTTYLVGGAVRDKLLKRPVKDKDYLVVGATVEQMLTLGYQQVGKDFPVFLHPQTKEEYALARTERKQGQGYTGFSCYFAPDVTIEDDLKRRDLSVNAMAMDELGNIIDPYNGQQDLNNRVLRHVSDAFIEDPLRVLRVARFAARYHKYGFTIAAETIDLMRKISSSGELKSLPPERVWQEMQLSLADGGEPTDINSGNPEVFFEVLQQCGALPELWPELAVLWGIPNPAQWHPEICSGIHTMMVLQQAVLLTHTMSVEKKDQKIAIRFAALCHDLGKGLTLNSLLPSHKGHEKTGLPLVEKICKQLKVPAHYKQLALKVCEFHLHSHKAFELKASTLLKMFDKLDVWRKPDEFNYFLITCKADFLGRLGFENRPYPQIDYLQTAAAAARAVTAKAFVEQGLQGLAIKEAMAKSRLAAIATIKATYQQEDSI
ncbi:multifunctional CCA addition/repair protein [Colwellia sp. E2M01]|uniref:multifunctional CCA addition/repair protein n=1 Tax=Colwellia sp. E2M01 TaxID=2841561 RepID=UPI001C0996E9|nr:multifunctional CCA addition/repair protein [Colwellia sp. E2M01]MBU2869693.1 multifunctional CCA addition/repair protein [Colwellia sp. E2M01]